MVEAIKSLKKWLVIGETGQLGSELIKILKPQGKAIHFDRNKVELEVLDAAKTYIELLSPAVILNASAWTDVDAAEFHENEAFKVNSIIPQNLAKIAKNLGIPFIHISTDYVFSGNNSNPWKVNSQLQPINAYGRTKANGEIRVIEEYSEKSYIFRTAWLYSANRRNFAKTMVKMAFKNKEPIYVVNDQFGQPTNARDLANQIIKSVEAGISPGIYHATNSGEASWNEFAREIFKLVGENPERVLPLKSSEIRRPAIRPTYSVLSHDCWENSGVAPMRNWKESLMDVIVEIKIASLNEESK